MENITLELNDIKYFINYISEAVVVSDECFRIVAVNDAALKKLDLNIQTVYEKKLMDYIPKDELYKVQNAIKNNINDYYEVILKRESQELFPALVSGKELVIEDKRYRVSTILDVSELKNKEQELISKSTEQLKQLKHHVITKTTSSVQEVNKIKEIENAQKSQLQSEISELKYDIMQLNRKASLMAKENKILLNKIDDVEEKYYNFKNILDLEISKAKSLKLYNFTLAVIQIDDFIRYSQKVNNQAKIDMITKAIKRQFKHSLRSMDVVEYETDGYYFVILPNSSNQNSKELIDRLVIPKRVEDEILTFSCGIAVVNENDDSRHLYDRAHKDLEKNKQEQLEKEKEKKLVRDK